MKTFALYAADQAQGDVWPSHAPGEADYCSRDGALNLKAKIEAYWRERGQNVMLSLHNVGFHPAIRAARFDVRSDMVNGMPRGVVNQAAARRNGIDLTSPETIDIEDFDDGDDDLTFE